jgi:hypothetical protein
MLMTLLLFWIASIGVPAAIRPAEIALDHVGDEPARASVGDPVGDRVGQTDHLDRARTVGQPANEAALLERRDQAVDPGFGTQIERLLHLVEGRRHAGLLQPLMNKAEQLVLLARQHSQFPPMVAPDGSTQMARSGWRFGAKDQPKQIMNRHYPFHMCSATL